MIFFVLGFLEFTMKYFGRFHPCSPYTDLPLFPSPLNGILLFYFNLSNPVCAAHIVLDLEPPLEGSQTTRDCTLNKSNSPLSDY